MTVRCSRPKLVANPVKPKLLSRQTAGVVLGGVNVKTVSRLIQRGKLRGVKVGTRSMVDPDSIDAYLAEAE
jgi:excisionase family DNA binding protein